jgi:hypothetical protein
MGKLSSTLTLAAIIVFLVFPLFVSSQSTDVVYPETKQVISIVNEASQEVEQKGEAAFVEFRKKGSRWLHDDTYVFVIDREGKVILNPTRPELEGKNQLGLKDAVGKPFIKWFIKEVTDYPGKTQGWSHYVWFKPGQEIPSWKTSFVRYVKAPSGKGYIVGSGLYEMRPERAFVVDIVEEAACIVGKEGRRAFPTLRDKTGEFNYLTTYVFVIDAKGHRPCQPRFPATRRQECPSPEGQQGKILHQGDDRHARKQGQRLDHLFMAQTTDHKAIRQGNLREKGQERQ